MTGMNNTVASFYRYMVTNDPSWNGDSADVFQLLRKSEEPNSPGSKFNTINPDLSGFRNQGGKLIQYHGWNDASMAPRFSTIYYDQVVGLQSGSDKLAQTQKFYRLFMVPGMGHCLRGDGPVNFGGLDQPLPAAINADDDVLEALDLWSENGVAPQKIIATQFADEQHAERKMPLCPWLSVATYLSGDVKRAESFVCKAPATSASK